MTLQELLKAQGLTDEQIAKVVAEMNNNKLYVTDEENISERYSKLKGQKEALEVEIDEANKTIKSLKDENGDNEALQQTIKEHEGTIEKLKVDNEAKVSEITFNHALDVALRVSKAKNPKAVQALLNREALKLDGESIEGLEAQIKALKESDSYLFEEVAPITNGGAGNFGKKESSNEEETMGQRLARQNADSNKNSQEKQDHYFK